MEAILGANKIKDNISYILSRFYKKITSVYGHYTCILPEYTIL